MNSDNTRPESNAEIWTLIDAVLCETADDRQMARLAEILSADSHVRNLYLDYCEMHSSLMFHIRSSQATERAFARLNQSFPTESKIRVENNPDARFIPLPPQTPSSGFSSNWFNFFAGPVARAAMISAFVTALGMLLVLKQTGWLHLADRAPEKPNPETTLVETPLTVQDETVPDSRFASATLTGIVDGNWNPGSGPPQYGEPLFNGRRLSLESGLAQITYESGARMVIQGPADFTILSDMEGKLDSGRITAVVPESAHGFTVRSPQATVVDLGTEFGMDVDDKGETEVHVFSGEVVTWQKSAVDMDENENQHIEGNRSITFSNTDANPRTGEANPDKFIRNIEARLAENELPPLPVKSNLALWLAADMLVRTDERGRVVAWQDILAGENRTKDDAWQFVEYWRPRLVEDAIGGRPAVRFDGRSSFLMTTPMTTTDDQTVFVVFNAGQGSLNRPTGGQLLNYNGPPHRHLTAPGSAGVLQIGDLASTDEDSQRVGFIRTHVFAGWKDKNPIEVGSVFSKQAIQENQPTLCTFQYSPKHNRSELFINGESQGSARAPSPIGVTSRKVIGRHGAQNFFFLGDIAEILIYNDALSADDIAQIDRYFRERYQLQFPTPQSKAKKETE